MDINEALFRLSNQKTFKEEEVQALNTAIEYIRGNFQFSFNELDQVKAEKEQLIIDKNQAAHERDFYRSENEKLIDENKRLNDIIGVPSEIEISPR